MNAFTPLLAIAGIFIGLLVWSHVFRISTGIAAAVKQTDLAGLVGELTRATIYKVLAALFVASCVWAALFGLFAVHFAGPNVSLHGWAWFFGGAAATPAIIWLTTLRSLKRLKFFGKPHAT